MPQRTFGLILLACFTLATIQQTLVSPPPFHEASKSPADEYQFAWPIQWVAVIGAGPSGLVAYRELSEAGLDVHVFERDTVPGGNWHHTEEVSLNAPVPNAPYSIGDFVPSLLPGDVALPQFEDDGEIWRDLRKPKPIWASLTTNSHAPVQQANEIPSATQTPKFHSLSLRFSPFSGLGLPVHNGNSRSIKFETTLDLTLLTDKHAKHDSPSLPPPHTQT